MPLSVLQFDVVVLAAKDLIESGLEFVGVNEASIQTLDVDYSSVVRV